MFARRFLVVSAAAVSLALAPLICQAKVVASQSKHTSSGAKKLSLEDRAMDLVNKVTEVRKWENEFGAKRFNPNTGGRPGMSIEEHHGSLYVVHVFEDMPEHAVTFARYEVNVKTGRVHRLD